jgi:hypothetical protein
MSNKEAEREEMKEETHDVEDLEQEEPNGEDNGNEES